jgi:hypothetical protein
MKAIKYQGVLWLKSGKCRTIEHPVFDVDEVLLQNKQQAEENGRLKELVSEIPELLGEYDGIHNCIGKHCAICRINAFKAATNTLVDYQMTTCSWVSMKSSKKMSG